MKIRYVLLNPTGNRTILVKTPVQKEEYKEVAKLLLTKEPTAEQVGFLETQKNGALKLNMAGGEFCGNATMSAAVYEVMKKKTASPVSLKVSGAKGTLKAEVWKDSDSGKYQGRVKMPSPNSIEEVSVTLKGEKMRLPAVFFDGITHLILSNIGIAKKKAEECAVNWCRELGVSALGLMFYDAGKEKLKPLVYVQSPATLYWESSCGSGSVALAAWLYESGVEKDRFCFAEPGGKLSVTKKGKAYYLEGEVTLEKEEEVTVRTEKKATSKNTKKTDSKKTEKAAPKSAKKTGTGKGVPKKEYILAVLKKLDEEYGTEYRCYLNHRNAWQLLFATIMSAQCTDERVNIVTKDLYVKYKSLEDFAKADLTELEEDIHSTGFYHNKAKNIIACAKALIRDYNGEVPSDIESLTSLPGVGRKTANVIRGNIYHIDSIVVDTHVKRISNKLGFTTEEDPVKIEFDLMEKLPQDHWTLFNIHIITLGRTICKAQNPKCEECFLKKLCPSCKA